MNTINKQSGFIAGGLEFLLLAALVGGFAATDQAKVQHDQQAVSQIEAPVVKAPVLPGNGFTPLDSNMIAIR